MHGRRVALVRERFASEAVPEIVDLGIRDGPGMSRNETQWMAPRVCWWSVRKLRRAASHILLVVSADVTEVASVLVMLKSRRATCAESLTGNGVLNWKPPVFTPSPMRKLLAGYFAAALASIPTVTGLTSTNGFPVGVFVLLLKVVVNWFSWAVNVTGTSVPFGKRASNRSSPVEGPASGTIRLTVL